MAATPPPHGQGIQIYYYRVSQEDTGYGQGQAAEGGGPAALKALPREREDEQGHIHAGGQSPGPVS